MSLKRKLCHCILFTAALFLFVSLFTRSLPIISVDDIKRIQFRSDEARSAIDPCMDQNRSVGVEALPKGIVTLTTDLEMRKLTGQVHTKENKSSLKSLLALAVGIPQKQIVNEIVEKFLSNNFTVMLLHYDGVVDEWNDLEWSNRVLHVSAMYQTKWWFAKRFLHPDIVAEYEYIFIWDEDIEVEHFHPRRYLEIVKREGLEISQPALGDHSSFHYSFTKRQSEREVHRSVFDLSQNCTENATQFPCAGFAEIMVPVFTRAAWRCVWPMIQNDLVHAWGIDFKFGYCVQGDKAEKIGVVDSEYIVHKGLPTLGGKDSKGTQKEGNRTAVIKRCVDEMHTFHKRWQQAADKDLCWTDPYKPLNE
ncbi:uncharacterized protein LOC141813574 [Curcuma longa]|uniref:uncharacterized protein LOC141813574 n=1 Tax=Curcuma longa TaxID=136217 RepID=UPI003D9F3CC4